MTFDIMLLGILVFVAETIVLTLGTVRTMVAMQGESRAAFFLGVMEMLIWVFAASAVLTRVSEEPFLAVCYALGFATGTVTGIFMERKMALGNLVVRLISSYHGESIAKAVRDAGFGITTVAGEGSEGPVTVQFVVCRRKDLKYLLETARKIDEEVFYTYETARGASEAPKRATSARRSRSFAYQKV